MISCERIMNKLLESLNQIDLELVDLALKNAIKNKKE